MDDGRKDKKERRRSREGWEEGKEGKRKKEGGKEGRRKEGRVGFLLESCVFPGLTLYHINEGNRVFIPVAPCWSLPQNPDLNGMCEVVL